MLTKVELIDERHNPIVVSNRLIQNSYFDLNMIPLKCLLYTISKIEPNDTPFKEYKISIRKLCEVCNMPTKGTNAYKGRGGIVYKAMRELRGKDLDLFDENGNPFNTGWFSSVKLDKDNDTISLYFDVNLMPYLFNLKKELGYTITNPDVLLAMESPAGIRLYLFLRSIYSLKGRRRITLDEIRERTGNAGRYELYADVRRFILNPALKDINAFGDIEASYNEVKEGKKVVALDFNISLLDGEALANSEYRRIHKLGY